MSLRAPSSGISGASASAGVLRRVLRAGIRYLLRATFNQPLAAPLPALLPVDIGDPLSLADTNSEWSQVAGVLRNSNSAGGFDKDIWLNAGFARVCGRTQYIKFLVVNNTGAYPFAGWSITTGAQQLGTTTGNPAMYFSTGTGVRGVAGADLGDMGMTVAQGDIWEFWFTLRNQGGHITFRRNGGPVTLLWVSNVGANSLMYPHYRVVNKQIDLDILSIFDLGMTDLRFLTDYGLATSRLTSGAIVNTDCTADAVVEWSAVYSTTVSPQILPRYVDTPNRWSIIVTPAGLIQLTDINAGVATVRLSVATGLTNGQSFRVVLIMEGNVYRLYLNNVLMGTYTDPGSFLSTVTTLRNNGSNTTEVVCWPRTFQMTGFDPPGTVAYLMRATFSTDMAAPLPASLPIDVSGPLTVVDTGNKLSQSAGVLTALAATGAADPRLTGLALTRGVGLCVVAAIKTTTTYLTAGFASDATGASFTSMTGPFVGAGVVNHTGTAVITGETISVGVVYQCMTVLRGAGEFHLIRGGLYPSWTLTWVGVTGIATPLYPSLKAPTAGAAGTADDFRVLDLGVADPRFATDYGLATSRLTNPAAGVTTTNTPDAVIEWSGIYSAVSASQILPRYVDMSNRWSLVIQATALIQLADVNAGATTLRFSVASGLTNGQAFRLMLIMEGNVYRIYLNNALMGSYTDPTSFQTTVTTVRNNATTTTELVCWPRTVDLPGGV